MKNNFLLVFIIIILGYSCSRGEIKKEKLIIQSSNKVNNCSCYSELCQDLLSKLQLIDKSLDDFYSESNNDSSNVYNELSILYGDSILIAMNQNIKLANQLNLLSISDSLASKELRLLNSLYSLINEIDEIDALLYPSSVRVGYTERSSMLRFFLYSYLNKDVTEMLKDYPN